MFALRLSKGDCSRMMPDCKGYGRRVKEYLPRIGKMRFDPLAHSTAVSPSSILWGYDSLIIKDLRRHFTLHGGVRPPDLGADSDPESSSPALSISLAAPPTERQHARSAGGFRRSFGTTVPPTRSAAMLPKAPWWSGSDPVADDANGWLPTWHRPTPKTEYERRRGFPCDEKWGAGSSRFSDCGRRLRRALTTCRCATARRR